MAYAAEFSNPAPLLIGHRGASGYRPEHTAAAYRLAFAQGVDAVEPDIVVSRDGVLVVRHECEIGSTTNIAELPEFAAARRTKTIDGQTLTGWFAEDLTWEQLATLRCRERLSEIRPANTAYNDTEPPLRLSDLLDLTAAASQQHGKNFKLVIELKHVTYLRSQGHDLPRLLCETLAAAGWHKTPERIIIECFELSALKALQQLNAPYQLVYLLEHDGIAADSTVTSYQWYRTPQGLHSLRDTVHGISVDKHTLFTPDQDNVANQSIVSAAAKAGLQVYTWTLRPENEFLQPSHRTPLGAAACGAWRTEWQKIIATGVAGVFVDHPALYTALTGGDTHS